MGKTKYGRYIITDTEEPAEYPRTKGPVSNQKELS